MKKTLLIALAVFALALFGSSASLADGCCIDTTTDSQPNGLSDCSDTVDEGTCGAGVFVDGFSCNNDTDTCYSGEDTFSCDFGGDCVPVTVSNAVPTLSQWGMLALVMLMLLGGTVIIMRKRGAQTTA